MTISMLDRELKEIVTQHHVYGAECIVNSLVRACKNQAYLNNPEYLNKLLDNAIRRVNNED